MATNYADPDIPTSGLLAERRRRGSLLAVETTRPGPDFWRH